MTTSDTSTSRAPRPSGAEGPTARAFGACAEDIDLHFAGLSRPTLVTRILAQCLAPDGTRAFPEEEIRRWTLPQRLRALISVSRASGEERLPFTACCSQHGCGEIAEMEVALTDFPPGDEAREFDWSPAPGEKLSVALPTGADQESWLARGEAAPRAMARDIVRAVNGAPPPQDWEMPEIWLDPLESELKRRDPLTALELQAACPACGAAFVGEIDLEAELLKRLHARQARLLREIHRLAAVYHWSEGEILSLPPWRRAYYLDQFEAGR
jgi:hypothetical protein